ncbi:uncharacterized protein E0L32_000736 [Thyridium curvatum]|uniref:NADH dehydrogenase [ubiquinone] 1 alpha subcomplex subunit 13 n=1 Tax=Thyridium curvatum TaxID=1093900 RepID=A0A507B5D0_9PEZI|nr:uncharacterized protein E0L32_000736 [Thyridium curvatum]TPX12559.1 hypothetical protein E0L32_000736 [Thyridium curvatum]
MFAKRMWVSLPIESYDTFAFADVERSHPENHSKPSEPPRSIEHPLTPQTRGRGETTDRTSHFPFYRIGGRVPQREPPRDSPAMPQDMPPVGGYGAVQYKRNLPARGFRPAALLLGAGLVMGFGWYKLTLGIREQNELAREKMWSRIHLIPLLQAEEDRDLVRRHLADQAREKELLGENMKVYNSDRYVRPTFAVTPEKVTK